MFDVIEPGRPKPGSLEYLVSRGMPSESNFRVEQELTLFDRKGWQSVRFGDIIRMLKEQVYPVADGVEGYVASELCSAKKRLQCIQD